MAQEGLSPGEFCTSPDRGDVRDLVSKNLDPQSEKSSYHNEFECLAGLKRCGFYLG